MGGWSDKTKFILISTLVEVVVEVEVELGKKNQAKIIMVLECDSTEYSADSAAYVFFGTSLSVADGCLFLFCLSQGLGPLLLS